MHLPVQCGTRGDALFERHRGQDLPDLWIWDGKTWEEWGYSELYMTYQQFEYVNMFFLMVFFTN